jgi:hypothetical protein
MRNILTFNLMKTLTKIGSHLILKDEATGKKNKFADYEMLVSHINRNGIVNEVTGLEQLPEYYFNRLDPQPETEINPIIDWMISMASTPWLCFRFM